MNKPAKSLLVVLIVLGIIYFILSALSNPIPDHPFLSQDDVLVMAHRGGRNLWPENTSFAFKNAVDLGVDVLEMDVHSTKDGVLVVMHDDTVDRTTNGTGMIQEFSLVELQELDAGYNWTDDDGATYPYRNQGIIVPTLEEVFAELPDMLMNIEIKQSEPSIVEPLCELIRKHGKTEQVLIASFDLDTIRSFRSACPEIATTAGEDEVRILYGLSLVFLGKVYSPNMEVIQVPEYRGNIHVLTPRLVRAAHGRHMEVHVWTVNEVDEMERMLDLGVDGIITDNPDVLLTLLGR